MSDQIPDGEFAIVEVLGHRTYVGRISEVERFGTKLMQIEPIFRGALLPGVLIGGGSIYQFTPCSKDVAIERSPDEEWHLPAAIRCVIPPAVLAAPVEDEEAEFSPSFLDQSVRTKGHAPNCACEDCFPL